MLENSGDQIMLPCQFFAGRDRQFEGLRRLMLAVLQDAIRTCIRCADRRDRAGMGQLREVMYWIERKDSQGLFSFENVCELLELDPDALRLKMREICGASRATRIGIRDRRGASLSHSSVHAG